MNAQRPRQTDLVLFRKVLPFLKTAWPLYVTALVIAPLSAVGAVAQPYLLKVALDDYIAVGDVDGTRWIALAYLGMVVVTFLLEAAYTLAISHAAMQTIAKIRETVYTHTLSLSRRFFDHQPSGRLLTRATSDVEALGETLTAGALTIALDVVKVLGILVAMFLLDAWLSLVMLLMAPVIVIVVEFLRRILRRLYLEIRTSLSELNAYISERLTGIEIVQLYTDEARSAREHVRRLHRYRDATIRTNVYDAALYAIIDGLGTITMALMLLYGAGALFEGSIVTAGLLAAFIDYVARLYRPIQEFSSKVAVIQRAVSALEKIFGLLDVDDHILEGDNVLEHAVGRISVRDVSFSYGEGPRILSDVSLDLQPGATIAVVGRTGSGKTTLGKVLSRAYDGYTGNILIDGHELRTLDAASARRCVATVQQDVQLFPGTVRFNLTLGAQIPDDAIREAIELARAGEVVTRLGGLDGLVAHGGSNVSVGEAQLLSFARTLAAESPVVILDEATANVDTLTETRIQAATEALLGTKTVLVIAHRLSTIIGADQILVMDAGRIVEAGTHSQLLKRQGRYAALFAHQFTAESQDASA